MAKEKKPYYKSFIAPVSVAASAGVAHQLKKDLTSIEKKVLDWDRMLVPYRHEMAEKGSATLGQSLKAIDAYIAGGRQVSRSKILGIPGATGRIAGAINVVGTSVPIAHKFLTGQQLGLHETKKIKGVTAHYKLFSGKKTHPAGLRGHMLEKAMTMSKLDEWHNPKIFTPEIKNIIHSKNIPTFEAKHKAIEKISPKAGTILREAIVGTPSRWGGVVGEAQRLVGNTRDIMSTPEIYYRSAEPFVSTAKSLLKKYKYVAGATAIALAIPPTYKFLKQAAKRKKIETALEIATAAVTGTGAVATTTGIKRIIKPGKHIGVTYGTMPQIGAGHSNPGKAIMEAMKVDPRFDKFKITALERDPHGMFRGPNKKFVTIVNTGIGGFATKESPLFNPTRFTHGHDIPRSIKAERVLRYQTDIPSHEGGKGSSWVEYPKKGKRHIMTWGPEKEVTPFYRKGRVYHTSQGISPAISENVVKRVLSSTETDTEVLEKIIKHSRKQKVPEIELKSLESLKGKKLITISGSARGDYVASRAHDVANLLKKYKLDTKYGVLALMAGSKETEIAKIVKNVPHVGKLPQELFIGIQHKAKINWSSTGASVMSENLLAGNIQAFPTEWGAHGANITKGSIAARQDKLAKRFKISYSPHQDIEAWNKGNIRYATKAKGVVTANKPEDIVNVLKSETKLKQLETASKVRSAEQVGEYYKGRQKMTDVIYHFVQKSRKIARGKGALLAAGGLAVTGAAGYKFLDYTKTRLRRK